MVVQARAEATRRRIIDAAIALFSEEGYGDTGLAAIMDRADVSKGAFYYHFESKEALASAIIDEGVTQLLDGAYRWFAANRLRITGRCDDGTCAVGEAA